MFQGQFTKRRYLPIGLCGRNCVILPTNSTRFALNKEILNVESVSGEAMVDLVYKFDERSYRECLKR